MNELTVFKFNDVDVRTVTINSEPWFVAKDVATILCYSDTSDAIKAHCKGSVKRLPLQTAGGMQEMRIIPESDLYRLIIKSNMPEAEKFEKWVMEEVLPSIRKTGSYSKEIYAIPKNYTEALKLAYEQSMTIDLQKEQLQIAQPKVEFYDSVINSPDAVPMSKVAKVLNYKKMGRNNLFEFLRYKKVLQADNIPYQSFVDKGWFSVKESEYKDLQENVHIQFTTYVFQKGIEGIMKLLDKDLYKKGTKDE